MPPPPPPGPSPALMSATFLATPDSSASSVTMGLSVNSRMNVYTCSGSASGWADEGWCRLVQELPCPNLPFTRHTQPLFLNLSNHPTPAPTW
jgi:hypothetical protein